MHFHCLQGPSYDHKKKRHDANNELEGRTKKLLLNTDSKILDAPMVQLASLDAQEAGERAARFSARSHRQFVRKWPPNTKLCDVACARAVPTPPWRGRVVTSAVLSGCGFNIPFGLSLRRRRGK